MTATDLDLRRAGTEESRAMDLQLPPRVDSPARARQFVDHVLGGRCPASVTEATALLVSELVTNAVRHAGTDLTLTLVTTRDGVRVEVRDHSAQMPQLARPTAGSGRGLMLVERIAHRWGMQREGGGKVVWCELTPRSTEDAFSGMTAR